jgi:hypothetical protein
VLPSQGAAATRSPGPEPNRQLLVCCWLDAHRKSTLYRPRDQAALNLTVMRLTSLWFAVFVVLGLETALQCTGAVAINSDLHTWIADNGGFVGFQVDKPCNACERGAFATKAYAPGDVIASVPLAISLKVGEHSLHTAGALYEMLHLQPEVNESLALFWATQPRADDILTLDTFTPEQTDMLQSPPLAKAILDYQEYKARLFHSTGGILNRVFTQSDGRVIPSFDAYKHVGGRHPLPPIAGHPTDQQPHQRALWAPSTACAATLLLLRTMPSLGQPLALQPHPSCSARVLTRPLCCRWPQASSPRAPSTSTTPTRGSCPCTSSPRST